MPRKTTKKKPAIKVPPKSKGGADKQTKYRPEYDKIAANLIQYTGATIAEVAEILSVSIATVYHWQARFPSFRAALQITQSVANQRVELSCYQEAVGYFTDEEEIKVIDGKVQKVKKRVWQRPNPTLIIWWTKVKAGWQPPDDVPPKGPGDDGGSTIDEGPMTESDRQLARRLNIIHYLQRRQEGQ